MLDQKTKLAVFFTWDVSLKLWREKGLYEREIKLYQELVKDGIDVTFLSWGDAEEKTLAPEGIKVIPVYEHLKRHDNKAIRFLMSFGMPWVLREQLKDFDLYKSNQMWGAWCAALSKLFFRKPFIMRCGFELYDFTRRQGHNIFRRIFVRILSWLTYLSATHICVATSEDSAFVQKKFGIKADKISVHPNWIDTDVFQPIPGQEVKPNSILFVGRLNAQKNIRALIDAVKDTGWTLDFIGDGELRRDIKVKGADVNFLGPLPNDQLPALYNQYAVYVLPSHYEGNPKTLLEAMSCGRPVLGSNVPGIRNVITHEETGLLCTINPRSIQDGLARLLEDQELREKLGRAAREQIISTQTLSMLVKKELALYKKLL